MNNQHVANILGQNWVYSFLNRKDTHHFLGPPWAPKTTRPHGFGGGTGKARFFLAQPHTSLRAAVTALAGGSYRMIWILAA